VDTQRRAFLTSVLDVQFHASVDLLLRIHPYSRSTGGCLGPTAGPDELEKKMNSSLCLESNPDSSNVTL
jgi:hypothetical protein